MLRRVGVRGLLLQISCIGTNPLPPLLAQWVPSSPAPSTRAQEGEGRMSGSALASCIPPAFRRRRPRRGAPGWLPERAVRRCLAGLSAVEIADYADLTWGAGGELGRQRLRDPRPAGVAARTGVSVLLLAEQALNGVQLGVMLFLMAAGLTLVLGIMNLINLAHGSLYMVGAYVAGALQGWTGSFVLAALLAIPATLALGVVVEVVVLRTLYARDHLDQVLATFGLILFFNEAVRIVWGPSALFMATPDFLSGQVALPFDIIYPSYRFAIIAVGLAVAPFLYWAISHTRVRMLVLARASDR